MFRPYAFVVRSAATAVVAMELATASASAGVPDIQILDWDYQELYELPPQSHLGERLAVSREGTFLLVASPDDGARAGFFWDDEDGWMDHPGASSYGGPGQFYELAPDSGGVAFSWTGEDGETAVRLELASGETTGPLVHGIEGLVTAIAKDGNTLAVGENRGGAGGRVRIYVPFKGTWQLQTTFFGEVEGLLGFSLALDGDVLAAGAPWEGDCGAVHLFVRAGTWKEVQTIDCPVNQVDAGFGESVALGGGALAVGAPRLDKPNPGGGVDFGGVYVYRPGGELFTFDAFLRPEETAAGDGFGTSVELYAPNDANLVLLAGAPLEDGGAIDTGAAYLYFDWGDAWRRQSRIGRNGPERAGHRQGADVALGRTGVFLGVPGYPGNFVEEQGAVWTWNGLVPLFYDGFGRGNTSAWSGTAP